jgi:DsbC/DsbD-like thiol-disulfide interchange protein
MKRLLLALALATLTAATARAADSLYQITKVEPKVAVGGTGTASLTIKVNGGWHVNDEAPISVVLTPPSGLTVKKDKLTRADLAASSKESARFDIPVTASEAGKKTIGAEARFVLCQEQACKPVKETVTLAIDVTPAAAAKKKKN